MITFKTGDIFKEDVEALVNPVNCAGVMGAGLAEQFKYLFTYNYLFYRNVFSAGELQPGKVFVAMGSKEEGTYLKFILNFTTKDHYKDKSKLEYIRNGLLSLKYYLILYKIKSVAIPALGCGLDGLKWDHVKPLIVEILGTLNEVNIIVFEPN